MIRRRKANCFFLICNEKKGMIQMKKYNTIVFDLDGTLLDTLDDLAAAVNFALSEMGMPQRTREEVRNFVGNGVRRLMELAVPDGFDNPKFEETFEKFRQYYGIHCNDRTKAYDGILELLQELKKEGYAIAIVSNKLDSAVKELNQMYFTGLVEVAIGEKEGVARKPAPDTVLAALCELGKTKEDAIYVGDSDVDLETAKNVGIPCISVLWGFRDRKFLEQHHAKNFAEVPTDIRKFL